MKRWRGDEQDGVDGEGAGGEGRCVALGYVGGVKGVVDGVNC